MVLFPSGMRHTRREVSTSGVWLGVKDLEQLGVSVVDVGSGRIGLCPEGDRCIPVPVSDWRDGLVDLTALSSELGFVYADDGTYCAVRPAPRGGLLSRLGPGDPLELTLRSLGGELQPVVPAGERGAVFAWASW